MLGNHEQFVVCMQTNSQLFHRSKVIGYHVVHATVCMYERIYNALNWPLRVETTAVCKQRGKASGACDQPMR